MLSCPGTRTQIHIAMVAGMVTVEVGSVVNHGMLDMAIISFNSNSRLDVNNNFS